MNALEHLGADVVVTSEGQTLLAEGMILPGNGAFGASKKAMERLSIPAGWTTRGWWSPVLGICVGHQTVRRFEEFGKYDGMGMARHSSK